MKIERTHPPAPSPADPNQRPEPGQLRSPDQSEEREQTAPAGTERQGKDRPQGYELHDHAAARALARMWEEEQPAPENTPLIYPETGLLIATGHRVLDGIWKAERPQIADEVDRFCRAHGQELPPDVPDQIRANRDAEKAEHANVKAELDQTEKELRKLKPATDGDRAARNDEMLAEYERLLDAGIKPKTAMREMRESGKWKDLRTGRRLSAKQMNRGIKDALERRTTK